MNYRALLFVIFLTIFITSCIPGQTERGFGDRGQEGAVDAFTGTKGVDIALEQPSPIITFPGEQITFPIRIVNEGRYDTTVTLYVSGYDKSLVQYRQEQQTVTVEGKKSAGPGQAIPGETKIVYFETNPVQLVGTSLPQNAVVTACFPYQTELTYGVCVDRNANGACDLAQQPQNSALSAGQGAPVAISTITGTARGPSVGKTRITYSIKFIQSDTEKSARVVKKEKLADACQGKKLTEVLDFDLIHIDEVRLGADINLDCPAISSDRPLSLKTTNLVCTAEIPYDSSDYTSGLYIKASYGFMKSVTQPITIQALTT